MKKNIIFVLFLSFIYISIINANENNSYDYSNVVYNISQIKSPYIQDGFLVFTEKKEAHSIGIVFSFENYKIVHQFKIHETHDVDNKVLFSCFYYLLAIPKNINTVNYRIIIDGLWTTDPNNKNIFYDSTNGISLSQINIPQIHTLETDQQKNGIVHFIYKGKSGKKITIGGTFTNWDPSIYQLNEIKPGIYELDLALSPGTYYYNYYMGITPLLDNTNRHHAYRKDGRPISVIKVTSTD